MLQFKFDLFADYFQFYIQDEAAEGDLSASWTDEAMSHWVALAPGTIGVRTARNTLVPVIIEVLDEYPEEFSNDTFEDWDKVFECSIDIPTGTIAVAGCTDYFPDADRIEVKSGAYRARIYCGNLQTLREDGLEGDDQYKVVLWLAPLSASRSLK